MIRPMADDDVEFAASLAAGEGWGNTPADYRRLIALEPEGCFVAMVNGEPAGMITTSSFKDLAFIGSLIVKPSHRGQKLGTRLLGRAITYLQSNGVESIELDAEFAAVSLYRRLTFRDKYLSLRFVRRATAGDGTGIVSAPPVPPARNTTGFEIASYDKKVTELERGLILKRLCDEFKDGMYGVGENDLAGYALVRPLTGKAAFVGPVVATDVQSAEAVLACAVSENQEIDLHIGVPSSHASFIPVLQRLGFVYERPSLRMVLGGRRNYETAIFGILSPEKG
jgi:GNAT superfamily N-acetyltransferase